MLLRHTRLTIFDEPEAGIDLWSFGNLIDVFRICGRISRQHAHHLPSGADFADRRQIAVIAGGTLKRVGAVSEVMPELIGDAEIRPAAQKGAFAG